jgi:hypothetical protein
MINSIPVLTMRVLPVPRGGADATSSSVPQRGSEGLLAAADGVLIGGGGRVGWW